LIRWITHTHEMTRAKLGRFSRAPLQPPPADLKAAPVSCCDLSLHHRVDEHLSGP
jgi:hypothetical protein